MHGTASPLVASLFHHRFAPVEGGSLHYVALGDTGSPVLLVHGFPETWRAFEGLMLHLATRHRVFAVDLRGFGQSTAADADEGSRNAAADLHALIGHLGLGPVHLLVQDVSGTAGYRLAVDHPEDLLSVTAVESGLAGFGLEVLADVAKGGAWYIGVLSTPGAAQTFFSGRERQLIEQFIMPAATASPDAIAPETLSAIAEDYAREGAWSGPLALYSSILREGSDIQALAAKGPLTVPALAIDRTGSDFTLSSFGSAHGGNVRHATIDGVGHYIAMEAPDRLADQLMPFIQEVDASRSAG